jgi:hypothetical protein
MHNSKGGYVEPSVDQKVTLHKQLFGTNPDTEMAFDESNDKIKKSKVKTVQGFDRNEENERLGRLSITSDL